MDNFTYWRIKKLLRQHHIDKVNFLLRRRLNKG